MFQGLTKLITLLFEKKIIVNISPDKMFPT